MNLLNVSWSILFASEPIKNVFNYKKCMLTLSKNKQRLLLGNVMFYFDENCCGKKLSVYIICNMFDFSYT